MSADADKNAALEWLLSDARDKRMLEEYRDRARHLHIEPARAVIMALRRDAHMDEIDEREGRQAYERELR